MKRRTKKQVRDKLAKLAKNWSRTEFLFGLASDKIEREKFSRLSSLAAKSFWCEFYSYFGTDDLI